MTQSIKRPALKAIRTAAKRREQAREQQLNADAEKLLQAVQQLRFIRREDCLDEIEQERLIILQEFASARPASSAPKGGDFIRNAALRAYLPERIGNRRARLTAQFDMLYPLPSFDNDLNWLQEMNLLKTPPTQPTPMPAAPALDFQTLLDSADAMTITQLKRACKCETVKKVLIDKSADGGVRFEFVRTYRMGKYTLMPYYGSFEPHTLYGYQLSSINGYLISEKLFTRVTNALRALWVFAQLMDHLLDEDGELVEGLDRSAQQSQFYVLHGLYSR